MIAIKTEQTNVTYTAEGYGDLPARRVIHEGRPCIECCWELSEEELEKLKQTRRVYVSIVSTIQPPICVSTIPLPEPEIPKARMDDGSPHIRTPDQGIMPKG